MLSARLRRRCLCGDLLRVVYPAAIVSMGLCSHGPSVRAETANRIIAVVNDEVITQADVAGFIAALHSDPNADPAPTMQDADVRRAVLQQMIDQRLILQEAKRSGIAVDADEVFDRYNVFRQRFPDDEMFHRSLAEAGLTEEQLKRRIREQAMVQRVIEAKVRSTIMVSPQEVATELGAHPDLAKAGDRMRVSHLLIRVTDSRTEAAARALIADLRGRLAKGEEFATVAKRYSEDQHRADGGAMGWVAAGELLPELDAALAALPVGQLSEPVRSRLGFHLVRVEERKPASSLPLMEANQAVYQQIYQKKYRDAMTRWVAELRRKAYIQLPDSPA